MILFLGGDGEMKTRVMNVLSAESLPSTAWDGTIALISPLDVGRVYVDASVPDAPNVGDVQIRPNLSSSYAYVIGDVTVPYADIYQYSGATWEKMTYYRYDGTEWKPGRVYLLDGSADTGVEWNTPMYSTTSCSVIAAEGGYRIAGSNGGNQPAGIQTASKIDLTGFSVLHFKGYNASNQGNVTYPILAGIQNQAANSGGYDAMAPLTSMTAFQDTTASGEFDLTVDINEYNGLYYVGISGAYEPYFDVYQIWLEV